MNNIILLVLCFVAGILLRRARLMPDNAPATLNSFIIHISVPALTLLYIHELRLSADMLLVTAMAWLCFALAVIFFRVAGKYFKLSRSSIGALILTGGMGNTAFFGLPMIEAYYGHEGMSTGILIDQTGSYLVLSTVAIIVAGIYSSGRPSVAGIMLNIVRFPPFISLAVALLLLPVVYPEWLLVVLKRLGDTLAPMALLSVGLQLRLGHLAGNGKKLALGLGYKLLLLPALLYLLYVPLLGAHGQAIQITLFEAAMPPMIAASIIAQEHKLDPELAVLMVAAGLLLSFFTLGGWWWLLRGV